MLGNRDWRLRRLGVFAVLIIAVLGVLLLLKWPFTSGHVRESLARALQSNVSFRKYHYVFFPSPGCNLESVTVTRGSGSDIRTLATAGTVAIRGSWHDLLTFRHRIPHIDAESLRINIP